MSEVKRIGAIWNDICESIQLRESSDGEFVKYEDYAELKAERDALAAEVDNTREQAEHVYAAGYNHGHLNTVDGIAYAPGTKDEFYHNALQVMMESETPATDAYLKSVRADGVEAFAHQQRVIADSLSGDEQHSRRITARRAEDFAAKLRAGKDGE